MKKITLILTISLALGSTLFGQNGSNKYFEMQSGLVANVDYVPQTIIIKLKPEYRDALEAGRSNAVNSLLTSFKTNNVVQKYAKRAATPSMRQAAGVPLVDLSLIYELKVDESVALETAINQLYATGMLEYVELNYLSHLQYTPNDPMIPQAGQYHLRKINAFQAWDIVKSDSTIVVGFADTGTAYNHRDLKNNIKKNWADPVNGIDDDNDGYIDNFRGYDLGQGDNNATVVASSHGSHVTACGVAHTDNGAGMAGPGFGSYYIPVKVTDSNAVIVKGYEGIVYLADRGVKLINCSWGQNAGYSQSQQDAVTYATGKGALIIGSAGNFGNSTLNYPSSYQYVLSVANTDSMDLKVSSSNYGPAIDLCAPGRSINSAIASDAYLVLSGTSMAAGVASGCAALVMKRFPNYNALQVGEQLKATTDNIYGVNSVAYKDKLGTGRINLFRAVTETPPMISMPTIIKTDYANNIFSANDTVDISGKITNFLDTTEALKVTLRTTSPYITIIDSISTIGVLNTLDTTDNYSNPFTVYVKPGTPTATVTFQLVYTDSNYVAYQTFTMQTLSSVSILENSISYSALAQNYPNPSGTSTTIEFELKSQMEAGLEVYDVTGRKIETLVESKELSQGKHSYNFNTEHLPNGIYYYSLRAGVLVETRRMVVMRE
ncbi:MAG: S8 family serine peptidase [Bacteroidota bacterium]